MTKLIEILALNRSKILKHCSICFIPIPRIQAKLFLPEKPDKHSSLSPIPWPSTRASCYFYYNETILGKS